MRSTHLRRFEAALAPEPAGRFGEAEISGLSALVQRYFRAAVQPATPVARSARIAMRGHIRIGRWIPFRADEILTPHRGFAWAARAAGVISGSDRYLGGAGAMDWKLVGLLPVMAAAGPDVSRSAAERASAEAVWVPTSLLPRFGATWSALGPRDIGVVTSIDDHQVELQISLTSGGLPRSVRFERWGDPDGDGSFGLYPFGGEFTSHATFDGLTIPAEGNLGWHWGSDRWVEGEFFRFAITAYQPLQLS